MEDVFGGITWGILKKWVVSLSLLTRNESGTTKHKNEQIKL
jgi:hypothetical protein